MRAFNAAHHRSAFTMIEVLLVLLIMATVAVHVAPRFAQSLTKHQLQAASQRLKADIEQTQLRARHTSEPQQLIIDVAHNRYLVPGARPLNQTGEVYQVRLGESPYRSQLVDAELTGTTDEAMEFNAFGLPANSGRLTLQSGAFQRTLEILGETGVVEIGAILPAP